MQKVWIFIGRLNPPHLWHITTIDKSLNENDLTIVFLWSTNILDKKNPLSFEERKYLLEKYFNNNIVINWIEDIPDDENWVKSLWNKINNFLSKENSVKIYAWDFENDYAIEVIKKYEKDLWVNNLVYEEVSRKIITINHLWEEYLISSTLIRKAFKDWNLELVKKMIPKGIFINLTNTNI